MYLLGPLVVLTFASQRQHCQRTAPPDLTEAVRPAQKLVHEIKIYL